MPNASVQLVSDAGATICDTGFTLQELSETVELAMVMDDRPHTLLARMVTPLIKRFVARAVESDLDAVKEFCEADEG